MEKIDKMLDMKTGFIFYNHFEFVDCDDGKNATLKVKLGSDAMNPYQVAHGGLIFGLGDTAMGLVAYSTGRRAVTISSNINYLKPAVGEYLIAKAEMIKNGKTTCYLRVNIYNNEDLLVATMDGNYYYID